MIAALEIALLVLACLFLAAWVLCAAGYVAGLRRAAKATASPLRASDLAGVPWFAFLGAINAVWFIGMLAWYGLLRRPLPPPPRPWLRR